MERLSIASSNERAPSMESQGDVANTGRNSPTLSNTSLRYAGQEMEREMDDFEADGRIQTEQSMASGIGDGEEYVDSDLQKAIFSRFVRCDACYYSI